MEAEHFPLSIGSRQSTGTAGGRGEHKHKAHTETKEKVFEEEDNKKKGFDCKIV